MKKREQKKEEEKERKQEEEGEEEGEDQGGGEEKEVCKKERERGRWEDFFFVYFLFLFCSFFKALTSQSEEEKCKKDYN